jgi:serine/threonine protein kinase
MASYFEVKIPVNSELSPEGEDMLRRMLEPDPNKRITPAGMLKHPFLVRNKIPKALPT